MEIEELFAIKINYIENAFQALSQYLIVRVRAKAKICRDKSYRSLNYLKLLRKFFPFQGIF